MARYWIADSKRKVLGPVGLDVLGELAAAGKLGGVVLISRDGGEWAPVGSFPELAAVLAGPPAAERRERERQEAERLRLQLDVLREKPIHAAFGVRQEASREELRKAFFALVKRYHPDRVPAEAHPDLKAAYEETFDHLSSLMADHDRKLREAAAVRASPQPGAPSVLRAPQAALRPGPVRPPPTYRKEEFVGLERRAEDRMEVKVKVTLANAGMFFDNRLVNLSTGGLFLESQQLLPLGTGLDLIFDFLDPPGHRITATGRVMWENADARPGQPQGFGVKFLKLAPDDLQFIEEFVRRAKGGGR